MRAMHRYEEVTRRGKTRSARTMFSRGEDRYMYSVHEQRRSD